MSEKRPVSVIVPTFRSARQVDRLLFSLQNQLGEEGEVILVDNVSEDRIDEVASSHGARLIVKQSNRSRARNLGAASSRGGILLFLDSDMEAVPGLIPACVKAMDAADGLSIREVTVAGASYCARSRALEKDRYFGSGVFEFPRAFRREAFLRLGGYNEELVYREDIDLLSRFYQAGLRLGWVSDALLHHEEELTFRSWIRKARSYSAANRPMATVDPTFWRLQRSPAARIRWLLQSSQPFSVRELPYLPGLLLVRSIELGLSI